MGLAVEWTIITKEENILHGDLKLYRPTNIYKRTVFSPEYVIRDFAVFKLMFRDTFNNQGEDYYTLVFMSFRLLDPQDVNTCLMKGTLTAESTNLEIKDKTIIANDGTWLLIGEQMKLEQFKLFVLFEFSVLPPGSFAPLYEDDELTDFVLKGVDGSVNMHKAVLAAASPVLRRMLSGPWREAAEGEVDIKGASRKTLQHLKEYLYLGTLPTSGVEQLLLIAAMYAMPQLRRRCVKALTKAADPTDFTELLEFAIFNKLSDLTMALLKCVQNEEVKVADIEAILKTTQINDLEAAI